MFLLCLVCSLTSLLPPTAPPTRNELLARFRREFVKLPVEQALPYSIKMGNDRGPADERPAHEVTIKRSFDMATYEVTQELYEAVMGNNPSRWKGARNSVEMVSFADAQEFCRQATQLLRQQELIQDQQVVRLPTEAEWELAARADTVTLYSFGDDPSKLGDYAWFTGNAKGNDPPVGAKQPNPWGLYDMHGYLWEWCEDEGHPNYQKAPTDGSAWLTSNRPRLRVLRGGSWKDQAATCTSSTRSARLRLLQSRGDRTVLEFRGGAPADLKDDAVGFRCVIQ